MNFSKYKLTGQTVNLNNFDTKSDGGKSVKELKKLREKLWHDVAQLQEALYAESKQSVLIVLQAMDAAGKDSTIEKLTRNLNAQGCQVHSFKSPTKKELAHDFLWRVHAAAPQAGDIAIFNRSHYEDVLIVKVHGWASPANIQRRYQHINNFESLINDRGTKVIKFMLNISPEYQLERFKSRLQRPEKNWKFNPGDLDERELWSDYMAAFESAMTNCASEDAPWFVVPAENRYFRDVMIAAVIKNVLEDMKCEYPEPDFDADKYTVDSLS
ncbi:MAG: polyphosphate kinase 2 family protein [Gammaproteobacteria bacterium]|nr:polyphosphate kinase 2 family protein [Gammaproteobacteria bacterium]